MEPVGNPRMDRIRNFYFLLKDVARLTARNFERHAAEVKLGLTLAQCRVLVYLQRNEGVSQVRLAYLTDTDPMTLVRILDRMERDGWLERRPDPSDRRARRLFLKPAAHTVLRQIWAIGDRSRGEALAGLDVGEKTQLLDLLERIHGNLNTLLPGSAEQMKEGEGPDDSIAIGARRVARSSSGGTKRRRVSS
jgi:DNA-binding MarR family transcriptional regulator